MDKGNSMQCQHRKKYTSVLKEGKKGKLTEAKKGKEGNRGKRDLKD